MSRNEKSFVDARLVQCEHAYDLVVADHRLKFHREPLTLIFDSQAICKELRGTRLQPLEE